MFVVTVQDVADRWRTLTPDEEKLAAALLGDASGIIRAQYPGIDATVDAGALPNANVAAVVAGMVKRAMILGENEGVKSDTETVGPFSLSRQYQTAVSALGLTDTDRLLILGYRAAGVSVPYGGG